MCCRKASVRHQPGALASLGELTCWVCLLAHPFVLDISQGMGGMSSDGLVCKASARCLQVCLERKAWLRHRAHGLSCLGWSTWQPCLLDRLSPMTWNKTHTPWLQCVGLAEDMTYSQTSDLCSRGPCRALHTTSSAISEVCFGAYCGTEAA